MEDTTEMSQTTKPSTKPSIDPTLEARIAAMRANIRGKKDTDGETGGRTGPDVDAAVVTNVQSTQSQITKPVNFSILDDVLAKHGMESVQDSDGDDDEVMHEESNSDTSSYVSSSESDPDSDDPDSAQSGPLTAEERERILIEADNDGPISTDIPRTKNEVLEDEEPVTIPDFVIEATDPIESLGIITSVVGKACVVTGAPTPETKVLDIGSLLVFENRQNLGFIAETFGPVILPMFSVRFNSVEDLVAAGVELGKQVFVSSKHASYVFSETLRIKGTDASNIHDEEQSETEFSDDEQEAMYKSQKKKERRLEKGFATGRPQRQMNDLESIAMAQGMTYDSTQNQVRSNSGSDHPLSGKSYENRGGQTAGPGRGRGRGRPETNNFGRGPIAQEALPNRPLQSNERLYQRQFYQSEVVSNPAAPVSRPLPSMHSTQSQQALYEPLKRPS